MKKIFVILFLVFQLGTLYTQESEVKISMGILGYSFDFNRNFTDGYVYGRIGSFIYQSGFGLGVTISPLVFYYQAGNDKLSLTFANMAVDYNVLNTINKSFILGPFVSVNALKYGEPAFLEFRSGLRFSLRGLFEENSILYNEFFIIEAGYRYNKNDKHGFFATIGIDLFLGLFAIGSAKMSETFPDNHTDPYAPYPKRK
ncbi:MAG: hypothetical protein LBJ31_06605 [Treponema sp.]|jgi:hypothetical protein|nr:hypothetical protein [Treponema sp.]